MRFPAPRPPKNLAEFHRWALDLHRELEKFAASQLGGTASTEPAAPITSYVHLIFKGTPTVLVTDADGNQILVGFQA